MNVNVISKSFIVEKMFSSLYTWVQHIISVTIDYFKTADYQRTGI
jgi:hypothetical protein